jgi:hypothetical protein
MRHAMIKGTDDTEGGKAALDGKAAAATEANGKDRVR